MRVWLPKCEVGARGRTPNSGQGSLSGFDEDSKCEAEPSGPLQAAAVASHDWSSEARGWLRRLRVTELRVLVWK